MEAEESAEEYELDVMKYSLHSNIRKFPAPRSHILIWQRVLYYQRVTAGLANNVGLSKVLM